MRRLRQTIAINPLIPRQRFLDCWYMASWLIALGITLLSAAATARGQDKVEPDAAVPPAANVQVLHATEPADAEAGKPDTSSAPVSFNADIRPILMKHCFKCHGAMEHRGGLRLDATAFAQEGGDSGLPVVGGTLETNELYRRVSSDDRTYRMPKDSPPLSADELSLIRRWVEQGAAWPPTATGNAAAQDSRSILERAVSWFAGLGERFKFEYEYAQPFAIAFAVAQIGLLVIVRARTARANNRPWAAGRFGNLCARMTSTELLLVWLLLVAGLGAALLRGNQVHLQQTVAAFEKAEVMRKNPWAHTAFGYPPQPMRPKHPKRLSGTYYRGNCERNPDLFNGGNYLTALFRVSLRDGNDRPLVAGDAWPERGAHIWFEIERAPKTTDKLFSKELMSSVFLTETFVESVGVELQEPAIRLDTLAPAQLWGARYPLGAPNDGVLKGLIYVNTGRITDGKAHGDPSYAIKYDLEIKDGKLTDASDVWLGSFHPPSIAPPLTENQVPFVEWFSDEPIPPITGENSQDPKLLGVDDYVKKGLITAPAEEDAAPDDGKDEPQPTPAPAPEASTPTAAPSQ